MGENQKQLLELSFNQFLRVALQGSRVTSNGGRILGRELEAPEKPGLSNFSVLQEVWLGVSGGFRGPNE